MLEKTPLDDLSEAAVLDRAEVCATTIQQAEIELLEIAYQWAVIHAPERADLSKIGLPGREGTKRLGGVGVAEVSEFAAAKLGARIGRTTHAAARLIGDAQDLRHRHPELWGRVQAGEVRSSYARHVCAKTRELSVAEAAYVDAEVAESADGRIPWTRFEALVEGKVAAAAPELMKQREEQVRSARFAKRLRTESHGMASFMIRADVATITQIDAAVTALAAQLERTYPDDPHPPDPAQDGGSKVVVSADDRRVLAALILANPAAAPGPDLDLGELLPQPTLIIHLDGRDAEADEGGDPLERIARVEGHGPVTQSWLRDVLGPHARFKVLPVFDPLGQAPVDAYEIPARHRQAVRLMTPADCFPFAPCTSTKMQVDHTEPHSEGGPSAVGNYGPLTTTHHRIKTHGGWEVKQPFPGLYLWRDPHGAFYLVDHTGTRRLGRPASSAPPGRALHVYVNPSDLHVDWAA